MPGAQGSEEASVRPLLVAVGLWVAQAPARLRLPHRHVGSEHTEGGARG